MAFNVSALEEYVNQNTLPLLKTASLGAVTQGIVNIQTGVKHISALNILTVDPTLQTGSCAFNDAGTATFSQREIAVGDIKINMSFCLNTLESKWMNYLAKNTAGQEVLPFEDVLLSEIATKIAEKNEKAIWQGDLRSQNADLNKFDGFIVIVKEDATEVTLAGTDSVYDSIMKVYMAIPANVLANAVIFVGFDTYRTLVSDLMAMNLYHWTPSSDMTGMTLPGSNVKVIPVPGLNGTEDIIAGDPMNFYIGVDYANDYETFDMWYSKDNQEFRFVCKYKLGTQIGIPSEIVWANHNTGVFEQGISGVNGTSGTSGTSGSAGTSGTSGTVGA